eukprot:263147-Chlamydomonas_euryale.AAC.3
MTGGARRRQSRQRAGWCATKSTSCQGCRATKKRHVPLGEIMSNIKSLWKVGLSGIELRT